MQIRPKLRPFPPDPCPPAPGPWGTRGGGHLKGFLHHGIVEIAQAGHGADLADVHLSVGGEDLVLDVDADDLAHDAVDGGDAAIGGQAEGGDVFALVLDGGLATRATS